MNPVLHLPTQPGAAGDVARRLARWIGPGLCARDDSPGALLLLALGAALSSTRARADAALTDCHPHLAERTLDAWEASVGLLVDPGDAVLARQRAVLARWRAAHAGASTVELAATARPLDESARLVEIAAARVEGTDPLATARVVLLLDDTVREDGPTLMRLRAALARQAPAHVPVTFGRHRGGEVIPRFRASRGLSDSRCDRDVLQT